MEWTTLASGTFMSFNKLGFQYYKCGMAPLRIGQFVACEWGDGWWLSYEQTAVSHQCRQSLAVKLSSESKCTVQVAVYISVITIHATDVNHAETAVWQ